MASVNTRYYTVHHYGLLQRPSGEVPVLKLKSLTKSAANKRHHLTTGSNLLHTELRIGPYYLLLSIEASLLNSV